MAGILKKDWLLEKSRRNYQAKLWSADKTKKQEKATDNQEFQLLQASIAGARKKVEHPNASLEAYFSSDDWAYWDYMVQASSLVLAADPQRLVPLNLPSAFDFSIIHYTKTTDNTFNDVFGKYAAYKSWKVGDWKSLERLFFVPSW